MKPTSEFFPGYAEDTQLMEPSYLFETYTGGHAPGLMERGDYFPFQFPFWREILTNGYNIH